MARKKTKSKAPIPRSDSSNVVTFIEYEITDEPIQDRAYRNLPKQVKDAVDRLYYDSQKNPQKAIPELLDLLQKYPKLPQLYNYLSQAYMANGDFKKADAVILENIQRNPDYLFARLNYAQMCLERKEYTKIPEIFDNKMDLKLLYPKRNRFHISEAANFYGVMGLYYFAINEMELAAKYNEFLQNMAPDYSIARLLKRKLSRSFLSRLLNRLRGAPR